MPLLHRALAAFSFAALVIAPPAMAAKRRPDLSVKTLTESATANQLKATATIVTTGRARAAPSTPGRAKAPKAGWRCRPAATSLTVKVKALAPKQKATVRATLKA